MTTIMSHAYFSQEQKDRILRKPISSKINDRPHTNIYLTVDGREVEVTEVIKTKPNDHQKNFSDSQYLGMVTKWLRVKY
tara:strand:- start:256 stop:492 length:237 start_codon:yes stop_codon:yes gene_type:complete